MKPLQVRINKREKESKPTKQKDRYEPFSNFIFWSTFLTSGTIYSNKRASLFLFLDKEWGLGQFAHSSTNSTRYCLTLSNKR